MGVTEPITSPTYTLIHSYPAGRVTLHHADIYRLTTHHEVADLAFAELLESDGIVMVEWGDVVAGIVGRSRAGAARLRRARRPKLATSRSAPPVGPGRRAGTRSSAGWRGSHADPRHRDRDRTGQRRHRRSRRRAGDVRGLPRSSACRDADSVDRVRVQAGRHRDVASSGPSPSTSGPACSLGCGSGSRRPKRWPRRCGSR